MPKNLVSCLPRQLFDPSTNQFHRVVIHHRTRDVRHTACVAGKPSLRQRHNSGSGKVWKRHSGLWVEHPIYFRNLDARLHCSVPLPKLRCVGGGKRAVRFRRICWPDSGGLVYMFAAVSEASTMSPLGPGALFTVVKTAHRRRHSWHPLTRCFWQTHQSSPSSQKS